MKVRALVALAALALGPNHLHAYSRIDLGYYGIGGGSFSAVSAASKSGSSQGLSFFAQYGWGQELGAG